MNAMIELKIFEKDISVEIFKHFFWQIRYSFCFYFDGFNIQFFLLH